MKVYNPHTGWKIINESKQEIFCKQSIEFWHKGLKKLPHFLNKIDKVSGNFFCFSNHLTSLKNCPQIINGDFSCTYNKLTTLEGCPSIINGNFHCFNNNLTSLKGSPKIIQNHFNCARNNLTSIKGCPITVNGYFECHNNTKKFTKEEVIKHCNADINKILTIDFFH